MLQASIVDGDAFDASSLLQDRFAASVIHIGWRQIVQALVEAIVIVMGDEGLDPRLQIARHIGMLKQDAVLECLMPALDLALRLRMEGRTADMRYRALFEPSCEFGRDVRSAVVG